MYKYAL